MNAAADGRGTRPIRIANCSGFYGDRAAAMAELARAGGIDVLTGDYLAEVTMLILGKARAKDPSAGWASTFLPQLAAALDDLATHRIKLVVNAGGLDPAGLARATRDLLARRGHRLAVAHIEGDDVFDRLTPLREAGHPLPHLTEGRPLSDWPHQPLTANAYLGGFGIARALARGADIVITGRVTDAALTVGPAAWWWDWAPGDHDRLAGAVAAGHVIECGTQATGGNFSGFTSVSDLDHPGFPIAEIRADGSSTITKHPGTGGAVTRDTVTAQLLYEIGDPAYPNPDVTTHLDTVVVEDLGNDRVTLGGIRGSAPPATTKVAVTALGGWQNTTVLALTGLDTDRKADLVERAVRAFAAETEGIDTLALDRIGTAQDDPATQNAGTVLLRIAVQGTREAAGRTFSSRLVEQALASYPGLYFLNPPQPGSAFGVYWPAVIDQDQLDHRVVHHDGTVERITWTPTAGPAPAPPSAPTTVDADNLIDVPLGELVHTRSGDKGGDANLGVWARHPRTWPWLRAALTTDELRRLLPETAPLTIDRHELPNLHAVNFLVRGLLGEGATSTLRLDSQAKALGEWLRSRRVRVPASLLDG